MSNTSPPIVERGARVPRLSRPAHPTREATASPLSPGRYKIQFTADAALRDHLERLRGLLRSSVPDGDLAKVIGLAVSREIARLEARRFAKTKKPRKSVSDSDTKATARRIPAAVRRAVHDRDGGRCTYRGRRGRRCSRRHDLEYHHRVPFGKGGDHRVQNLTLMCRTHNTLLAEHDYGKEVMARHLRERGRASDQARVGPAFDSRQKTQELSPPG